MSTPSDCRAFKSPAIQLESLCQQVVDAVKKGSAITKYVWCIRPLGPIRNERCEPDETNRGNERETKKGYCKTDYCTFKAKP